MKDFELADEISDLIYSRREGDYWDFKQEYHHNKAELLKDIICMANNLANRDAFLIFGIGDHGECLGIENDKNRRKQADIIDFLKTKDFASGNRPQIELRTLQINNHQIDILIIFSTFSVPYYLTQKYNDGDKYVYEGNIYTRVGDTNTNINKTADNEHVEYLWKKRFGLLNSPVEQFRMKLFDPKNWMFSKEIADGSITFYRFSPEFTLITHSHDSEYGSGIPFFCVNFIDGQPTTHSFDLSLHYYSTELNRVEVISIDNGRAYIPCPRRSILNFSIFDDKEFPKYQFFYYEKDCIEYAILRYYDEPGNLEYQHYMQRLSQIIPIFTSEEERVDFLEYINSHPDDFQIKLQEKHEDYFHQDDLVDEETLPKKQAKIMNEELACGRVLTHMLMDHRADKEKANRQMILVQKESE